MTTPTMVKIRHATVDDAERISALAKEIALEFVVHEFTQAEASRFLRSIEPDPTRRRLAANDKYSFLVAEDGDKVVGVAAMQDGHHVLHLFVAKGYQRAGLTRKLWLLIKEVALQRGRPAKFTIDAPRYAVSAYARLGFQLESEVASKGGAGCQRMSYPLGHVAGKSPTRRAR